METEKRSFRYSFYNTSIFLILNTTPFDLLTKNTAELQNIGGFIKLAKTEDRHLKPANLQQCHL